MPEPSNIREKHVEVRIWCCEDADKWLNETKYSVWYSFQYVGIQMLYPEK
jgi:hypothetical protein